MSIKTKLLFPIILSLLLCNCSFEQAWDYYEKEYSDKYTYLSYTKAEEACRKIKQDTMEIDFSNKFITIGKSKTVYDYTYHFEDNQPILASDYSYNESFSFVLNYDSGYCLFLSTYRSPIKDHINRQFNHEYVSYQEKHIFTENKDAEFILFSFGGNLYFEESDSAYFHSGDYIKTVDCTEEYINQEIKNRQTSLCNLDFIINELDKVITNDINNEYKFEDIIYYTYLNESMKNDRNEYIKNFVLCYQTNTFSNDAGVENYQNIVIQTSFNPLFGFFYKRIEKKSISYFKNGDIKIFYENDIKHFQCDKHGLDFKSCKNKEEIMKTYSDFEETDFNFTLYLDFEDKQVEKDLVNYQKSLLDTFVF